MGIWELNEWICFRFFTAQSILIQCESRIVYESLFMHLSIHSLIPLHVGKTMCSCGGCFSHFTSFDGNQHRWDKKFRVRAPLYTPIIGTLRVRAHVSFDGCVSWLLFRRLPHHWHCALASSSFWRVPDPVFLPDVLVSTRFQMRNESHFLLMVLLQTSVFPFVFFYFFLFLFCFFFLVSFYFSLKNSLISFSIPLSLYREKPWKTRNVPAFPPTNHTPSQAVTMSHIDFIFRGKFFLQ